MNTRAFLSNCTGAMAGIGGASLHSVPASNSARKASPERGHPHLAKLSLSTDFGDRTYGGRVIEFARSHNVSSLEVVMNEWNTRCPGGRYLVAERLKDWLQFLSNA
jgi:hypothetical protein